MTEQRDPIDRLMDRGRIKGESRMIPDGTKPQDVTRAQAQAVIDAVEAYKTHGGFSNHRIARAISYGAPTVGLVLKWKYTGNWQEIVIELDRWLEDQLKRDAAPKVTDFVWTKVAQEIKTVGDAAATLGTIGLVYGPETSGLGKTITLQAIHAERAGSIFVTVEKVAPTIGGVLSQVCKQLRIGGETAYNNAYLFEKVKAALKGTPRLLIIDQVHNLCDTKGDKPFFMLADLNDATGAPQLWAGTRDIVGYLNRGQAKGQETLAQIRRRIGISRDLMDRTRPGGGKDGKGEPLYTLDEIRAVFAKNKMRLAPDAIRYLGQLANLPDSGALGACKNVVVMATILNEQAAGVTALTAAHLRAAHNLLVNRRVFSLLEAQMTEEQTRPAAARVG